MEKMCLMLIVCLMALCLAPCGALAEPYTLSFDNKIAETANDPWVIWHEDAYYYCWSWHGGVCVARVRNLPDLGVGVLDLPNNEVVQSALVWTPEDDAYSQELWAPELHYLNGKWYIYVAADDGNNANHRMLCLEANTDDPLDGFTMKGIVRVEDDRWAIDGTVLTLGEAMYFVWSGWEGDEDVGQNLYIARMEDPWTLTGERSVICQSEYNWEWVGAPIIEGPAALTLGDKVYIVYSASGSWTDYYCLGLLTLTGDDPMDPACWQKSPDPVFSRTEEIFAPGHASFTTSPDGQRHYIVYHANEERGAQWGGRKFWIQEFAVRPDDVPDFGQPQPAGTTQTVPVNWE